MENIYIGRGTHEQFDEYMRVIDESFGFTSENTFLTLLPKLYRPELDPAYHSFVAVEDGKMIAAVGAFPGDINVCGTVLHGVGIGNVAVLPSARKRGFMKVLMERAVDDMVENHVDFSALGGQRQRYNYFSYDLAGAAYTYSITKTNLRHVYGAEPENTTISEVQPDDEATLDYIAARIESNPYTPVRPRKELYAILRSWRHHPYVIREGERLLGYFVPESNRNHITEIMANNEEDFLLMVRTLVAASDDSILIVLPEFLPQYLRVLEPLANGCNVSCKEMFSVLCYRRVIEAFLKLKGTYCALPDGTFTTLIHGRGGDENLTITVENGNVSVIESALAPEREMNHLDAMRFFFSPTSMLRMRAPAAAQTWFPLPIYLYQADCV